MNEGWTHDRRSIDLLTDLLSSVQVDEEESLLKGSGGTCIYAVVLM